MPADAWFDPDADPEVHDGDPEVDIIEDTVAMPSAGGVSLLWIIEEGAQDHRGGRAVASSDRDCRAHGIV